MSCAARSPEVFLRLAGTLNHFEVHQWIIGQFRSTPIMREGVLDNRSFHRAHCGVRHCRSLLVIRALAQVLDVIHLKLEAVIDRNTCC